MPSSHSLHWLSLVGIIWLQSINGTNTDFPAYSSHLKKLLSISQVQLNNLAFASDAGKFLGWISGIAAGHLPLWLVLLIGAIIGLIGYGVQFLFLANITSLSYLQLFIVTVLAGNSICWINTVCYLVTIRNFSSDGQIAVGLSTSYVGLSAIIYTTLVESSFDPSVMPSANAYLLLNSIVPLAVSIIVCAPLTRVVERRRDTNMKGGFAALILITVVTGIYSVLICVGSATSGLSPLEHLVTLGALLASPLLIVYVTLVREWWTNCQRRVRHLSTVRQVLEMGRLRYVSGVGGVLEIEMKGGGGEPSVREEIGVTLMVRRLEFWLYFFVYMFGATLGSAYMNNLGQIAESRGLSKASSLVSLSSSFGFFGRLMPSLLDYFFSQYMVSRPACIATLMTPLAASFFFLLVNKNVSLYVSTATIGVCTGAITSITVSMTPELFGTKNFSVNHNVVVANIPIGSFLFGYLAALIYEGEGDKGHGRCLGHKCYSNTFIIWGSICSIGTLLSFLLYARTRLFYLRKP